MIPSKCPKGHTTLILEAAGANTTRVRCTTCGFTEVRDKEGKSYLTGTQNTERPKLTG